MNNTQVNPNVAEYNSYTQPIRFRQLSWKVKVGVFAGWIYLLVLATITVTGLIFKLL